MATETTTPPAGVTIIEGPPPSAPPAPTGSIQVSAMPAPASPAAPAKRGSAMDRLKADLGKRAKGGEPAPEPPNPPAEPPAPSPAEGQTPSPKAGEAPSSPNPELGAKALDPSVIDPKTGKANPWKLVDQYKGRLAAIEKQIADSKTTGLAEQQRTEYEKKLSEVTKKLDEVQNEMRFIDYTKHPEYQEKYQKPYEEAWQRAVSELSEINVVDPETNQPRTASAEDLMTLVNLPLGKARELAEQYFGNFADDVMGHRKEIRKLFETQQKALKDAKEQGGTREKQMQETSQKKFAEVTKAVTEIWEKSNSEIKADPKFGKFFAPVEGDEEGNARLQRGYELADSAFGKDPRDPSLSAEDRANIVRVHTAIRNRAAAFGRLVHSLSKAEAERDALKERLAKIESTTPATGGQITQPQGTRPASAHDAVFAALRAKAKST